MARTQSTKSGTAAKKTRTPYTATQKRWALELEDRLGRAEALRLIKVKEGMGKVDGSNLHKWRKLNLVAMPDSHKKHRDVQFPQLEEAVRRLAKKLDPNISLKFTLTGRQDAASPGPRLGYHYGAAHGKSKAVDPKDATEECACMQEQLKDFKEEDIYNTDEMSFLWRMLNRSIDLEEAGERNIFKVDILAAMRELKNTWEVDIKAQTIPNCFRHGGILPGTKITNSTTHRDESSPAASGRREARHNIDLLVGEAPEPDWEEDEDDQQIIQKVQEHAQPSELDDPAPWALPLSLASTFSSLPSAPSLSTPHMPTQVGTPSSPMLRPSGMALAQQLVTRHFQLEQAKNLRQGTLDGFVTIQAGAGEDGEMDGMSEGVQSDGEGGDY
ncbi:hypothetical protein JCM5296_005909 [Sporobolomyces johnsonii]